jgi:hypothetical protein
VKTWKKVTTWIVSILALLALIVGGTVLYLIQKSKKEERLVNSAYKELIPDNIDSYPELKNYYLNEPYRVCRRVNILRDYPDDKIKIYP